MKRRDGSFLAVAGATAILACCSSRAVPDDGQGGDDRSGAGGKEEASEQTKTSGEGAAGTGPSHSGAGAGLAGGVRGDTGGSADPQATGGSAGAREDGGAEDSGAVGAAGSAGGKRGTGRGGASGSTGKAGASGKAGDSGRTGGDRGGTDEVEGGIAAGSGGSGSAGKNGDSGVSTDDCTTPKEASPLVGWASVSGNGVTTTTGGGSAAPTTVNTLAELQTAAKGTTAAVVYVKGKLDPGTLTIGSNKTIVGLCGAEIHGHVSLNKSSNVILRNLKIVGYAVGNCSLDPEYSSGTGCSSGSDAISVQGQSHHLWFDHDDISDGTDGNLDITHASDYITISWTKFHYTPRTDNSGSDSTGASGHRYSDLVGHSDDNSSEDTGHLRITWHHDWWADNVVERQPRIRFGQVHLFNNLWTSATANYCIGVGAGANIRTENNVFVGVKNPINSASYSDSTSAVASSGNVYTNTSGSNSDLNAGSVFAPSTAYSYDLAPIDGLQTAVQSGAGPR